MASRAIQFFMLPSELAAFLEGVLSEDIGLFDRDGQPVTPDAASRPGRSTLFVGAPRERETTTVQPARHGWIVLSCRAPEGQSLFLSQLSAKDEFVDDSSGMVQRNGDVARCFQLVAKKLRQRLTFGMHVGSKTAEKFYGDLGYSDGAKQWVDGAGMLVQDGAKNLRFRIESNRADTPREEE